MTLFVNGLVPKSFSPLVLSLPWISPIPLRDKPVRPARKPDTVKETGLFSQLSSYLSTYATDEPSPPSDEEIERTLCTVDCLKSCHLEEVSRNLMYARLILPLMSRKLNRASTEALMSALLANVTIDAPDGVSETSAPSTPNMRAKDTSSMGSTDEKGGYDPSMLFVLEIATSLAIRDQQTMQDHGSKVAGYCTEILRQRRHLHPILVERSLIHLMAIKKRGDEIVCEPVAKGANFQAVDTGINLGDVIRAVYSTQSSQPSLFPLLAVPLVRSLLAIAEVNPQLVLEEPKVVYQILKKAILIPEAQGPEFDLCKLVTEKDGARFVTPRMFPLLINLLTDFATLGSVGAEWEQRNDVLSKRLKPSTQTPDKP